MKKFVKSEFSIYDSYSSQYLFSIWIMHSVL